MKKSIFATLVVLLSTSLSHSAQSSAAIKDLNYWIQSNIAGADSGKVKLSGVGDRGECTLIIEPVGRSYTIRLHGSEVDDPFYGANPPLNFSFKFELTPRTSSIDVTTGRDTLEAMIVAEANMQLQSDTISIAKIFVDGRGNVEEAYMAAARPGFFGRVSIRGEQTCRF